MATKKTSRSTAATGRKTASKKTGAKKATTKKATTKKASGKKKAAGGGTKKKAARKSGRSKAAEGAEFQLYDAKRVEREIGGRTLVLETGRMAKLADGAVVARYGDTMVLATAQSAKPRADIDFFPLTVDYREKTAAAGRIPGGFFKREGRPTTREILTCRIIDRSIRPLFPDGYRNECQVLSQVLATDQEQESDVVAAIASFAALAVSSIPNGRTLGMCRIGLIGGELVVNPTWTELRDDKNELNLTVAGHSDAIAMVEAGAKGIEDSVMLDALELAQEVCADVADLVDELVEIAGKEKQEVAEVELDDKLAKSIERKYGKALRAAGVGGGTKGERQAKIKEVKTEAKEDFPAPEGGTEEEIALHKRTVSTTVDGLVKQGERESILEGTRADGRDPTAVRPIDIEVGVLPRVHGSVLFTRGETQALGICTLGGTEDQQIIDGIYPEGRKRFLLHYAFPPFSVGEVKRFGAVGRREIGHGALAERSVETILPSHEEFPYTIRLTSEILESNGSSSMATVCAATMSMMDAGVPIAQPVAGIAMGLVMEGKKYAILSDILGSEDHCGDMDFKVAGTGKGLTALQMDIKCEGLTRELLEEALEQAREGRKHILRCMLQVLREPRSKLSPNAPRLESVQIPQDRIGMVIGPAGRNIRAMQEEYEVKISIEDNGMCTVAGVNSAKVDACLEYLKAMTAEVELGAVYNGTVTAIKEFGAFIEILPSQEGMCHVSELSNEFIRSVTDVVKIGDKLEVKVIGIDDFGKIKLSRKALLEPGSGEADADGDGEPRGRGRRDRDDERPRRGRRDRDDDAPRGRSRRDRDDEEPRGGRGRRDRDDEEPRGGRGRRDRDDEEPRGGRGRRDRDDEEPRGRGRRDRDDEEPRGRGRRDRDDEEPRGRSRRDRDDEPPRGGRTRRDRDDEEPRGRSRPDRDDEEPRGGRARRSRPDEVEDAPAPRRGRRPARDELDGEDGDEAPRRGRRSRRDEEEPAAEESPRRGGRGRGRSRDEETEEEPRPGGRGRARQDDDEDGGEEPRWRRRRRGESREEPRDDADGGEWGGDSLIGELEDAGDLLEGSRSGGGGGGGRRRRRR